MFSLKLYMLPNLLSHIIGCDTWNLHVLISILISISISTPIFIPGSTLLLALACLYLYCLVLLLLSSGPSYHF
jgi:hypothetical protein